VGVGLIILEKSSVQLVDMDPLLESETLAIIGRLFKETEEYFNLLVYSIKEIFYHT